MSQTTTLDSADLVFEGSLRFTYVAGGVTRVPLGHTTGWRVLPFVVLAQPVGGAAHLFLEHGGPPTRVGAGSAILIPTNTPHQIDVASRRGFTSRWAHFAVSAWDFVDVLSILTIPHVLPPRWGRRLGDVCARLARFEGMPRSLVRTAKVQALGFQLVSLLFEAASPIASEIDGRRRLHRIRPVLQFIDDHLGEAFSRDDLARLVHLSPTRFHFVFKGITGQAPMAYVQQLRLRRAQHLLAATDVPVSKVGADVGYADPFHFSRLFKAATSVSPMAYRRQSRAAVRFT